MPTTSLKNQPMAASADLGLGDQLQSQAEAEINERKKKLLAMQGGASQGLGPATQSLFSQTGGLGG
jgi:hypothetical protein